MKKILAILMISSILFACATTEDEIKQIRQQEMERVLPSIEQPPINEATDASEYTYTSELGNDGRGGAALRYPGFVHVLDQRPAAENSDADIVPREMWESKTFSYKVDEPAQAEQGSDTAVVAEAEVSETENSTTEEISIPFVFKKYCQGEELTDEEWSEFYKLGGTSAIPEELSENCIHQK